MHVRKRLFTFLFAALAMVLLTACGKWDYSREAMKAANEAQGETLRVEFKVNQTFTNALRAAAEDNIQPADVDKAMTMDKSIEKLLSSGYRLDVYVLRADIDADKAAAQLADEFVNRLAGCEDEGYISMVKAENEYFYEAVLVYKHDSGSSGGGAGDDGNTGGGVIDTSWVSWEKSSGTLCFMEGAGDAKHVGTSLEKADESKVKETLIARGELEEGDDFTFASKVVNLVIDEDSGITTINEAFANRVSDSDYDYIDINTTLKTATLNGVTTIGKNAFYNCLKLSTVTLPESENITIGDSAFYTCSEFTGIDFSNVTSIGTKAFYGCDGLTEVDLSSLAGDGSTSLGESAFCDCSNLTTVTLPENVKIINELVFMYCDSLTAINLSSVTHIGKHAFERCGLLADVDIRSVSEIGYQAFDSCKSLSKVNLGTGHKIIGRYAFADVKKGVTIFYGTGDNIEESLRNNLTVPDAAEGEDGLFAIRLNVVDAHYEPAASYTPSTTAYSIPNPAARFILNL